MLHFSPGEMGFISFKISIGINRKNQHNSMISIMQDKLKALYISTCNFMLITRILERGITLVQE